MDRAPPRSSSRTTSFPSVVDPNYDANLSDIAANPEEWIRENGSVYLPRNYVIRTRVDPNKKDAMINVSHRGTTGAGEKTLNRGLRAHGR